jgi:hypothetical protein
VEQPARQQHGHRTRSYGDQRDGPKVHACARHHQQAQGAEQQELHDQAATLAARRQATEKGGPAHVVEAPERLGRNLLYDGYRHPHGYQSGKT